MHNPLMQTTHHFHKTILALAIYISTKENFSVIAYQDGSQFTQRAKI